MPLLHFLLIYDHDQQALLDALELGSRAEDAARIYTEYEQRYRGRPGIEIVLVGADTLDTIRQTHAHYFAGTTAEPFEKLLAGA